MWRWRREYEESLQCRGRFHLESTSSTEIDSSIVSLQARFSDFVVFGVFFSGWSVSSVSLAIILRLTCVVQVGRCWLPFQHSTFC